jgi:DnaJ family protein C protein 13
MICYLDNYGPEKFSEIFLGEFDNPEAIWNMEMRKFMIRKIAVHLAEFTPRLKSNTRAPYQVRQDGRPVYPELNRHRLFLDAQCDCEMFHVFIVSDAQCECEDVVVARKIL